MTTVDGLPAHILLVHLVVVLIPLGALLLILIAVWPSARARLVWPTAILTLVALVSVPVTTDAGEWLERRVTNTALVHTHTELGDTMLPWAIGLVLVAVAILVRHRMTGRTVPRHGGPGAAAITELGSRPGTRQPGGTTVTVVLAVLAVVIALGSIVTVYRIGESGAAAAWTGQFSQQAQPRPDGPPPAG
jgi:hypothetical protein